ncbi:hypothetical protein ACGFNU_21145 [Spirillospora sp. NPDC048911]|uniref:hypothetical protein n=1 Tax=Spirillospora sp. NPDC048911 TaxID=3364527 RepID=UPI00371C3F03
MGSQILRQPDEQYAVFSTETETIIVWDATENELVEWFAKRAAERARQSAREKIALVAAGQTRRAYAQFAKTWDEALAMDREHGGDAWKDFEALERP